MNAIRTEDKGNVEKIINFAERNYQTYVTHYRKRKLTPMPLNEFLKNYAS